MDIVTQFLGNFLIFTSAQGLRYLVFAGGMLLLLKKFKNWKGRPRFQARDLLKKDIHREVKFSIMTIGIFGMVLAVTFNPLVVPYTKLYLEYGEFGQWWLAASGVLMFVIHDTYFYWMHKALHHRWFFKRFHSLHHLSTNPSPMASQAFHPMEAFLQIVWVVPLVFIIPFHPSVLIAFGFLSFLFNVYGHSPLELAPKKVQAKVRLINYASNHNRHHRYNDGNFGLYLKFWDRFMKTESKS